MTPTTQPTLGQRAAEEIREECNFHWQDDSSVMRLVTKIIDDLNAEQKKKLESLNEKLENAQSGGNHSCHENCPRLACVQRREIASLRSRIETLERERNEAVEIKRAIYTLVLFEGKLGESDAQVVKDVATELSSLRASRDEMEKDKKELQKRHDTASTALSFFRSVIKCGEPWTSHCDFLYDAAMNKETK